MGSTVNYEYAIGCAMGGDLSDLSNHWVTLRTLVRRGLDPIKRKGMTAAARGCHVIVIIVEGSLVALGPLTKPMFVNLLSGG